MIFLAEINNNWSSNENNLVLIDTAKFDANNQNHNELLVKLIAATDKDKDELLEGVLLDFVFDELAEDDGLFSYDLTGHKIDHHVCLWWE